MNWHNMKYDLPPIGERVLGLDTMGRMETMTYSEIKGTAYFAPSHRPSEVTHWTTMDEEMMQGWEVCGGGREPIMHTILVRDRLGNVKTDFFRKAKKRAPLTLDSGRDMEELEWREMPDRPDKSEFKIGKKPRLTRKLEEEGSTMGSL